MKYSQQLFIFCKYGNILLFSTFNSYFYTQKNPRLELRAISTLQFLGLYFLLSNFICYQSDFSELTQHNQRNLSHIFRPAQAGICNPKKLQYRKISLFICFLTFSSLTLSTSRNEYRIEMSFKHLQFTNSFYF